MIFEDVRLYGRRNDMLTDNDLSDSRSIISADSIEPNDSNELFRKTKTFNQYNPRKNLLDIWNVSKKSSFDIGHTDAKDFLFTSSTMNKNQGQIVRHRDRIQVLRCFIVL